jgi:uncharacterized protein YdhG (YjbR/CyaY superfamily)
MVKQKHESAAEKPGSLPVKKLMRKTQQDIASYIAGRSKEIRTTLAKLHSVIKKSAPKAKERVSYGMPFYEYGGSGFKGRLIYFAGFSKYIAVYIPPARAGESLDKLKKYQVTKSSFHFALDEPFPFELISQIVRAMVKKIDSR